MSIYIGHIKILSIKFSHLKKIFTKFIWTVFYYTQANMASKSKLLVRSHAIRESTSPPPSPINPEKTEIEGLKIDGISNLEDERSTSVIHQHVKHASINDYVGILSSIECEKTSCADNICGAETFDEYSNEFSLKRSGIPNKNLNTKKSDTTFVGQKPKFRAMGSSSSVEGVSSGFISRGKIEY